jgi:hypothetical protein
MNRMNGYPVHPVNPVKKLSCHWSGDKSAGGWPVKSCKTDRMNRRNRIATHPVYPVNPVKKPFIGGLVFCPNVASSQSPGLVLQLWESAPLADLPRRGFIGRRSDGDEIPSGYGNTFQRHLSQGGAALALGWEIVARWGPRPISHRPRRSKAAAASWVSLAPGAPPASRANTARASGVAASSRVSNARRMRRLSGRGFCHSIVNLSSKP